MSRLPRASLILALTVLLLVACDGDSDATPNAEATSNIEASASATATPRVAATTRPGPNGEGATTPGVGTPRSAPASAATHLDYGLVLVDLEAGSTVPLEMPVGSRTYFAEFIEDGAGGVLVEANGREWFDLDGRPADFEAPSYPCNSDSDGATVAGESFAGFGCYSASPDRDWVLLESAVDSDPGDFRPKYDLWLLAVGDDEPELLIDGLYHCGGCDGAWGSRWAASSAYVAISETGGARVYLVDVERGWMMEFETGHDLSQGPEWSPAADLLLMPPGPRTGPQGSAPSSVLFDAQAWTTEEIAIPWPAAWSSDGSFIYNPAFEYNPNAAAETAVFAVTDRAEVATLPAVPAPWHLWFNTAAVTGRRDGSFLAVLEGGSCDGTLIYDSRDTSDRCIEDAVAGLASPDGERVAFARQTGTIGRAEFPDGTGSIDAPVFDVEVYDVATGQATVVVSDAVSYQLPGIRWSPDGTHLVVWWPFSYGI